MHVTKLDAKGRISLPVSIRNMFNLEYGTELVLETSNKQELKISPLIRRGNSEMRVLFTEFSEGLRKLTKVFAENEIHILSSETDIYRDNLTSWSAIIHLKDQNTAKLKEKITGIKEVKSVKIDTSL
jgi:bifunctional DNA-binding transcriptional regulator/antitoxin component of YhaV-PrlF toxin-antitoxin module